MEISSDLLNILKVCVYSNIGKIDLPDKEKFSSEIVIMGNGPSLGEFLAGKKQFLDGKEMMCVNFSVESEYFNLLKPRFYIAADPSVFYKKDFTERLFGSLSKKVTWDINLFVPYKYRKENFWRKQIAGNPYIHVFYINTTPLEGSPGFCDLLYGKKLGMPRPHNVLIPALMVSLWIGFKNIYTAGVEHSWHKLLWVNDHNELMINDAHFYDTGRDANRRHGEFDMSTLFRQLSTVFGGYSKIERFSNKIGSKIYNITKGSFIDSFERKEV